MSRAGNASFFPDAKRAVILGREGAEKERSFVLDFASGTFVPITPPGTRGRWISPDGASLLARGADGKFAFYPVPPDAGSIRPAAGLEAEDSPIGWAGTGHSVFAIRGEGLTTRVFSVDTAAGVRKVVREFRPDDAAGVLGPGNVMTTPDGKFWVVYYWRDLSDIFLVEGLR
jgi:hypothetical protein